MAFSAKRDRSGRFRLSRNLALDLFSEFQGTIDFLEYFGGASGAAHDHRSVAQNSSDGWLIHHDALYSGEEDFGGTAFREPGLYDDPVISDGHLGDISRQ